MLLLHISGWRDVISASVAALLVSKVELFCECCFGLLKPPLSKQGGYFLGGVMLSGANDAQVR